MSSRGRTPASDVARGADVLVRDYIVGPPHLAELAARLVP